MVRGRDAADGAMITPFGSDQLGQFRVWTDEVTGETSEAAPAELLDDSPEALAVMLAMTGSS